ncbi:MAG TPA: dihydrodipicolinate synthase family protein [Cyclobacteriaceae bacterium]|jgi:N-acetylneuraminate lyase|nr:dihydrodipicolinate synthase family protein [Cytophagales bacterium]HRF32669.1 dihydrodipicolinate synthase family protein [Cyclobacteriaceae bacterium]
MNAQHLSGLISAPFTPMKEDGSLNLAIIPQYYELLKSNGVRGAFITGSTGEGVSMTTEEKKQVIEAWGAATKNDREFKVMPLVGGTSVNDSIDLAQHAQKNGLYAVAFTAPFYFKPANVQQLAETCIAVAQSVPNMPFYYYHIPVLTGVGFPMIELLKVLHGKLNNLAGIKYTHEDFMDFLSCLHFENGRYDMLWGRDENFLAALALGAKGAVGSTYNYAAPLYLQLIDAYEKGDMKTARQVQQKSIDMIGLLSKYGGISVGKSFMKLIGMDCGKFRLPVRNMTDEQYQLFTQDAKQIGFDNFCSKLV